MEMPTELYIALVMKGPGLLIGVLGLLKFNWVSEAKDKKLILKLTDALISSII